MKYHDTHHHRKHRPKNITLWLIEGILLALTVATIVGYLVSSDRLIIARKNYQIESSMPLGYIQQSQKKSTLEIASTTRSSFDVSSTSTSPLSSIDISKVSLTTKKWVWVKTRNSDKTTTYPKKEIDYTITFDDKQTVQIVTDCNVGWGTYEVTGSGVGIHDFILSFIPCDNLQEPAYIDTLSNKIIGYSFSPQGELIFRLKGIGGTMVFK